MQNGERPMIATIMVFYILSYNHLGLKDHNGRDYSSYLVKHSGESCHLPVDTANFEVIGSGCRNIARRRKIAKALLLKKLKPTLNIQKKSVPLKLFNLTSLRYNITSYRANFH